VRAFWLVQCVLLSLYWYWDLMRREARDLRYHKYKSWLPVFRRQLRVRIRDGHLCFLNRQLQDSIVFGTTAFTAADRASEMDKAKHMLENYKTQFELLMMEIQRLGPEDKEAVLIWKKRADEHKKAMARLEKGIGGANAGMTFGRFDIQAEPEIPIFIYWSDTDRARNGMFWGWVFFFCWSPFYVWMLIALLGVNLYAAIGSIVVGPLVLLPFCWCVNDICDPISNGCGQGGLWGQGNYCCNCNIGGNCNCNCDCNCCHGDCCGGCGNCCGDCGHCLGNCCQGCGNCLGACGECNCGGCDCGGCNC